MSLRRVLTATALVALLATAGCSGSSDDGSSSAAPDDAAAPTGPVAASLEDLAFDDDDLADGEQPVVPADGTVVSDASPSLAFCGIDLPSEADREERARVQVVDASYAAVASTEAVRYAPGASATALNELRGAFIDCPEDEPIDVGEGELVTYDAVPIDDAELDGLTSDHVGADITATGADGDAASSTIVAQRRGDVLLVVEGTDHDRVVALATAAGTRLAAADGASVGD